jgi:hypothetical protein
MEFTDGFVPGNSMAYLFNIEQQSIPGCCFGV